MTTLDALAADIAQAVVEHGFNPRALDEEDAWNMGRAEQAVAARLERALDAGNIVGQLLARLNAGQGFASIALQYDRVMEDVDGDDFSGFSLTVYRERDGKTFQQSGLSLKQLAQACKDLSQ